MKKIFLQFHLHSRNSACGKADFEDYIISNIDEISHNSGGGEVARCERQYTISYGRNRARLDIMLWHKDGTGTCIEVKHSNITRNNMFNTIGQVLLYRHLVKYKLGEFPRVVILSNEIDIWSSR